MYHESIAVSESDSATTRVDEGGCPTGLNSRDEGHRVMTRAEVIRTGAAMLVAWVVVVSMRSVAVADQVYSVFRELECSWSHPIHHDDRNH